MKNDNQLNLSIKNIRAIKNAEIIINGITVITGENGCGKSTISKLVYNLIKTSIDYDEIVDDKMEEQLNYIKRNLYLIRKEVMHLVPHIIDNKFLSKKNIQEQYQNENPSKFDQTADINYLIEIFKSISTTKFNNQILQRLERIKRVLIDRLEPEVVSEDKNIIELLEVLKEKINSSVNTAICTKDKRPLSILEETINNAFFDTLFPQSYILEEYGVPINDKKSQKVNQLYSVHNVAYIDTPMILGLDFYGIEREHWDDLNAILKEKISNKRNIAIDNVFENDIIKGDIQEVFDDFSDDPFIYKRNDGKEFNLLECATGLKSFAILRLLYKNGFLNDSSLLIIDEPEAHLHPQWVVEYARLIILLNKYLGVKFLIASHHPDMISAIKYIAEKEDRTSSLNYYLAKQIENTFSYNYVHLGTNIDDIFLSFNIALERIDLYGKTE